ARARRAPPADTTACRACTRGRAGTYRRGGRRRARSTTSGSVLAACAPPRKLRTSKPYTYHSTASPQTLYPTRLTRLRLPVTLLVPSLFTERQRENCVWSSQSEQLPGDRGRKIAIERDASPVAYAEVLR